MKVEGSGIGIICESVASESEQKGVWAGQDVIFDALKKRFLSISLKWLRVAQWGRHCGMIVAFFFFSIKLGCVWHQK